MNQPTRPASRRVLRAAVTGHLPKHVQAEEWAQVRREVEGIFDLMDAVVVRELGAGVRCLLHTSLAEGADRIVTEVALAHAWRINAFLPFPEERYRRDFADEASAETLSRQIWAARHVEEIDGERLAREIDGDAPYAAAGRALIEGVDLMLCVWNGLPAKGPGGTAEVAALMLERGGLVLWLPVAQAAGKAAPVNLIGPAPLPRAGSFRRKLHEALAQRYPRLARPPEMRVADGPSRDWSKK